MAIVIIDGVEHRLRDGRNCLDAALDCGLDLPYFCWHPALGSVGACRLCAVKLFRDASDTHGRIVMACMTPAKDGTRFSIADPEAAAFRRRVIEFLMANHPHDCPVCDEGGECHLQDMTVMTGHAYRRYRWPKRTFISQDLGPAIHHEMNRCIECYRCVRFYRDHAGGSDLGVFGSRGRVYFGRSQPGTLESPFSGNLVEVCPTGVFTDRTRRRHYTRKWDMLQAPSVCCHCGVGCNTLPGSREGSVRVVQNRFNADVNGYFLCDRGRFGYEFARGPGRVAGPRLAEGGPIGWPEATGRLASMASSGRLAVVGSPRASVEANWLARRLAPKHLFSTGLSAPMHAFTSTVLAWAATPHVRLASIADLARADAVLVLGSDVLNEAPIAALALHRARVAGARMMVVHCHSTWLDEGSAVVRVAPDRVEAAAGQAFDTLCAATRPAVVTGAAAGLPGVAEAAAAIAARVGQARGAPCDLYAAVPDCNTVGVALLGGLPVEDLLDRIAAGEADHLLVLENNIAALPGVAQRLDAIVGRLRTFAVLDHIEHDTSWRAHMVVATEPVFGSSGTFVNAEGRAQRFFRVTPPSETARTAVEVLAQAAMAAGAEVPAGEDALRAAVASDVPAFEGIEDVAPPASFRASGLPVARGSHRESGRTSMPGLQEEARRHPRPPLDPVDPFTWSGEGAHDLLPPAVLPRYWAPGWNSVQALNRFQQEVGGPMRGGDPGHRLVEPGTRTWPESGVRHTERVLADRVFIVGRPDIFGSEPLSREAPAVRARAEAPHLAVARTDAARFGLTDGMVVRVDAAGAAVDLPVRVDPSLAPGTATFPIGSRGTAGLEGPPRPVAIEVVEKVG